MKKSAEEIAGLSVKTMLLSAIALLVFLIFVGYLVYGDRGLLALIDLKQDEKMLTHQKATLQALNRDLQKKYLDLKQLQPKDDR